MFKNNRFVVIAVILLAVQVCLVVIYGGQTKTHREFHEHANIAVFVEDQQLDFSDFKYMTVTPCGGEYHAAHDTPITDHVHLHDGDGGTIHVHKEGINYGHFFESIGFRLTSDSLITDEGVTYLSNSEKAWKFFINGEEIVDLAKEEIRDLDDVLLVYTNRNASKVDLAEQFLAIPNQACIASGKCAHRGEAKVENCGA